MNELYDGNGRRISIHPLRIPQKLTVKVERFGGESQQVRIDFLKKRFVYVEWKHGGNKPLLNLPLMHPGSIEEFKCDLYSLNIWDWETAYHKETGIILDGKYWSIELETKEKVYQCDGIECYPNNWFLLCQSIQKLIGTSFGL